jgi:peptide/nickel transport system substrate-binding protein
MVTATPSAAATSITWGLNHPDAPNLNPFTDYDESFFVFMLVYEPLTNGGPGGRVTPGLATSWKMTRPTTWVFQLRHGARFSNGRPMVADDVVTSFGKWMKSTYAFLFSPAQRATAVGKYAVRFDLSQPSVAFPAQVETLLVLPGKELRDGALNMATHTLGTGPYVVKSHAQNVSWTFTANRYYWQKGLPVVHTVNVRLITDEASLDSALRSGAVDFEQTSDVDAARALAGPNIKVHTIPTPDFYYIAMNPLTPTEPAFKDQRVRQAVNLAINRSEIAQVALGGGAKATGMPPSIFADGCVVSKMPGTKPNLARARALMKAAGVSSLTTTDYISPGTGAYNAPQIAEVVKQNLAQIGITTNIVTVDVPTWVDTVFTKADFSMTVNWWTGFADPTLRPASWNPVVTGFDKNYVANDPTLDSLITKASGLRRSKTRTALFQKICQRVANDANVIPLVSKNFTVVYRSDRVVPVFPSFEPNQLPFRYIYKFKLSRKG